MLKIKLIRGEENITEYFSIKEFNEKEVYKNLLHFIIKYKLASKYEMEDITIYKYGELHESIQKSLVDEYDYVAVLDYNGNLGSLMNGITITGNSLYGNPRPTVTAGNQVNFTYTFLSQLHIGMKRENPQEINPEGFKKYLTDKNSVIRSLAKKIHKS